MADLGNGDAQIVTAEENALLAQDNAGDATNVTEDSGVEDPVRSAEGLAYYQIRSLVRL